MKICQQDAKMSKIDFYEKKTRHVEIRNGILEYYTSLWLESTSPDEDNSCKTNKKKQSYPL